MVTPAPTADVASASATDSLPRVGVVVLNWNSAWFSRRCLASLAATDYPADRLRVILVDNGSVDGSREALAHWLSRPDAARIELLANGTNLGFAEGCNRAMRELVREGPGRVDHVALLNNDAWAEPGWLRSMVAVMAEHPRCAAASARLLLEPGFVPVEVEAGSSPLTVRSVRLRQGSQPAIEVVDRVRPDGFSDEGALMWPPRKLWRLAAGSTGRIWVPVGDGGGGIEVGLTDGSGRPVTVVASAGGDRTSLVNGVGTGLNESGEGFDIGYGEPDPYDEAGRNVERRADAPDRVPSDVVDGFCGGAALLRSDALDEVGLFDPAYFAYYEDTDLSWRMRNAGWQVRTAPAAVVHHAFGASGGGGSKWHVFLDRRNWLVTNFRNGDRVAVRRALGWLWRGSWRLFRVNIFGPFRRGRPIQVEPLWTWKLAAITALLRVPSVRREARPGMQACDSVRSRFQPQGSPRPPEPWPGGPLVTYVDVGETLKAGYRAGIQRVVCGLVSEMGTCHPRLELVPIRWCERNQQFRRITAEEYESLLRAGAAPVVAAEAAAVAGGKRALRSAFGRLGVLAAVRRAREWVFGRNRRAVEDSLVMNRLAPGAVLFEVDAVWNETGVDRERLLAELRADGVHVASFVHDLLPIEEPGWFAPGLRRIFDPVALAQLRHSELLVAASEATATQILTVCDEEGLDAPPAAVVTLGSGDVGSGPGSVALPPGLSGTRYLLVVGTLEPRKNHALALEVFDLLSAEFPDLHLVLAGRFGWGVDDLVSAIGAHPLAGTRVHWLDDVHDDVLAGLYENAFLVLVPSLSEGFGLPLVEALSRGVPALASGGGALREAGGDAARYADPTDVDEWARIVGQDLADSAVHEAAVIAAGEFEAVGWSRTARGVSAALVAAFGPPSPGRSPEPAT